MKWTALLIATLALGACASESDSGSSDTGFPDAPYATVMTEGGALKLAIRTAPSQPPPRGVITVEYTITDPSGHARDGLDVTVTPWMPEMGHGASVDPAIEPLGEGRYRVSNVAVYMPGRWELRTNIAGEISDHAVVALDVR